jgi:restriction system protein
MNDFSLQRVSELIRGLIELLWTRPDGMPGVDVIAQIPEVVRLSEHEAGISPASNMPRYARALRLATLPLVKAGWIVKTDKGQWFLTADGRDACRRYTKPQDLFVEALRIAEADKASTPELIVSLEVVREKAWENISKYIREKNAVEIRRLIEVLFEAMDYHVTWVAPPQKDHGMIDMVASVDPIGLKSRRVLVQVKHTGQPVTVEGFKAFSSVLGQQDFGLLFSSGGFTSEVKNIINKGGYQKLNAMDLEKFYDVWVRHYDKLSREAHVLLPLKAIFFLSPPE